MAAKSEISAVESGVTASDKAKNDTAAPAEHRAVRGRRQDADENPHKGHRERLRNRFLSEGLRSFEPHNALELLLFYAIPQKDTNPLAHRLIRRFGGLSGVFAAPAEELMKVEGVGECAAALIKLIPELNRSIEKDKSASRPGSRFDYRQTGEYLNRLFADKDREEVRAVFYDQMLNCLGDTVLHTGNINSASFSLRKLSDAIGAYGASYLVLAHNHPGGVPIPSGEDLDTTREVKKFLAPLRVTLLEHYVVAGDRWQGIMKSVE